MVTCCAKSRLNKNVLYHKISGQEKKDITIVCRGIQSPLSSWSPLFFSKKKKKKKKKMPTTQSVSSSPIFFSQIILHTLRHSNSFRSSPISLCLTVWRFFSLWCIVFSENPVKEAYFFLYHFFPQDFVLTFYIFPVYPLLTIIISCFSFCFSKCKCIKTEIVFLNKQ